MLVDHTCKEEEDEGKELLPPYDFLEITNHIFKVFKRFGVALTAACFRRRDIKTMVPAVTAHKVATVVLHVQYTLDVVQSPSFIDIFVYLIVLLILLSATLDPLCFAYLRQNSLIYFDFEEFCTGHSCLLCFQLAYTILLYE